MNGSSLLALALREGENDSGADDKNKLRDQIAKGNLPAAEATPADPDPKRKKKGKEITMKKMKKGMMKKTMKGTAKKKKKK